MMTPLLTSFLLLMNAVQTFLVAVVLLSLGLLASLRGHTHSVPNYQGTNNQRCKSAIVI
jgi:hypothetical protein